LSDVFSLGYTVKILVAISRVAYLGHYNTVQLSKLKLPGRLDLSKIRHATNFTLKPNKIELLELLKTVECPSQGLTAYIMNTRLGCPMYYNKE
jgi:hypothetical protein